MTQTQADLAAYLQDYLRVRAAEVGYATAVREIADEADHVKAHGSSPYRSVGARMPLPPRYC